MCITQMSSLPRHATNGRGVHAVLVGTESSREGIYLLRVKGDPCGEASRCGVLYRIFKGKAGVRSLLRDYVHTSDSKPDNRVTFPTTPPPFTAKMLSPDAVKAFPGGPGNRVIPARTLENSSICWFSSFCGVCLQFHPKMRSVILKHGEAHASQPEMRDALAAARNFNMEPLRHAIFNVWKVGPDPKLNGEKAYWNAATVLEKVVHEFRIPALFVEGGSAKRQQRSQPSFGGGEDPAIVVLTTERGEQPPLTFYDRDLAGMFIGNVECGHQVAIVRRGQHLMSVDSNMAIRGIAPGRWHMGKNWFRDLNANNIVPLDLGTNTSAPCDVFEDGTPNILQSVYV